MSGQQTGPDPRLDSPNACLEAVFTELPRSHHPPFCGEHAGAFGVPDFQCTLMAHLAKMVEAKAGHRKPLSCVGHQG